MSFKDELLDKYKQTGRIGFHVPKTMKEALDLIDVLDNVNSKLNENTDVEEDLEVYSLSEITDKMKKFFKLN